MVCYAHPAGLDTNKNGVPCTSYLNIRDVILYLLIPAASNPLPKNGNSYQLVGCALHTKK